MLPGTESVSGNAANLSTHLSKAATVSVTNTGHGNVQVSKRNTGQRCMHERSKSSSSLSFPPLISQLRLRSCNSNIDIGNFDATSPHNAMYHPQLRSLTQNPSPTHNQEGRLQKLDAKCSASR